MKQTLPAIYCLTFFNGGEFASQFAWYADSQWLFVNKSGEKVSREIPI